MKTTFKIIILLIIATPLFSQNNLPVIKASSNLVDIRLGDKLYENQWRIMPDIKPDIHHVSAIGKTVTFYTDIDSISV